MKRFRTYRKILAFALTACVALCAFPLLWAPIVGAPPAGLSYELSSITVQPPTKTVYKLNEELNLDGGLVFANYVNRYDPTGMDTVTDIILLSHTSVTVSGFDKSKSAYQWVTVEYGGARTQFQVRVYISGSSSSGGSSRTRSGTNTPDISYTLKLEGIPDGSTVSIGEEFTLWPSPNYHGRWTFSDEYFTASINRHTYTATFVPIKAGTSRITYWDGHASADVWITIRRQPEQQATEDINPRSGGDDLSSQSFVSPGGANSAGPFIAYVDEGDDEADEEPGDSTPVLKETKQTPGTESEVATAQVRDVKPTPQPDLEAGGVNPYLPPLAMVGAGTSLLSMILLGIGICRYHRR